MVELRRRRRGARASPCTWTTRTRRRPSRSVHTHQTRLAAFVCAVFRVPRRLHHSPTADGPKHAQHTYISPLTHTHTHNPPIYPTLNNKHPKKAGPPPGRGLGHVRRERAALRGERRVDGAHGRQGARAGAFGLLCVYGCECIHACLLHNDARHNTPLKIKIKQNKKNNTTQKNI